MRSSKCQCFAKFRQETLYMKICDVLVAGKHCLGVSDSKLKWHQDIPEKTSAVHQRERVWQDCHWPL